MSGMATGEHRNLILWIILGILTVGILFFVYMMLSTASYNRNAGDGNKTLTQWVYLIFPFILLFLAIISYQRYSGLKQASGEGLPPILAILNIIPLLGLPVSIILELSYHKQLYGQAA